MEADTPQTSLYLLLHTFWSIKQHPVSTHMVGGSSRQVGGVSDLDCDNMRGLAACINASLVASHLCVSS